MARVAKPGLSWRFTVDSNVAARLVLGVPPYELVAWILMRPVPHLYLATPIVAELWHWVLNREDGRERSRLTVALEQVLESFAGRILPFGLAATAEYGKIATMLGDKASRRKVIDIQIASIATVHDFAVATQNTRDFARMNVAFVNPMEEGGGPGANINPPREQVVIGPWKSAEAGLATGESWPQPAAVLRLREPTRLAGTRKAAGGAAGV